MTTEYYDPDPSVREALDAVMEEYFPLLHTLQPSLNIDIRMAAGEDPNEPALKHHGHLAAATIETVKPKEKSKNKLDLRLTIDLCLWNRDEEETNTAKLHHELTHVELKYDKDGMLKTDAYGRPAIKLRPDDWCLTGFRETVRIFGEKSVERRSLRNVEAMLSQEDFGFMKGDQSAAVARAAQLDREAEADPEPYGPETAIPPDDGIPAAPAGKPARPRKAAMAGAE